VKRLSDHSGAVCFLGLLPSLRQDICRRIVANVRTNACPWTRRIGRHTVVVGYSLGANSSVFVANKAKHVDLIIALQPSMLSWNPPVTGIGPSLAQAEEPTVTTLSCDGTTKVYVQREEGVNPVTKMIVVVNVAERTVSFDGRIAHIDHIGDRTIFLGGDSVKDTTGYIVGYWLPK
jgi:hypothetical protein